LEPGNRSAPEPRQLGLFTRPGEIGVVGTDSRRIMVSEQRGVIVASFADALEPRGEQRMHPRSPRLGQARVRDLAGQCVLDDVLTCAGQARSATPTDEVALLEHTEIRLRVQEL